MSLKTRPDGMVYRYRLKGYVYYAGSTVFCTPCAMSQNGSEVLLGAQAGEKRTRQCFISAGFSTFRRAAETPFNIVYQARP